MPLSATVNSHAAPASSAVIVISGGASRRNLTALAIRFWNSCASAAGCAVSTGSAPTSTVAPAASRSAASEESTPSTTVPQSTPRTGADSPRTRDHSRIPSSSAVMRWTPPTMCSTSSRSSSVEVVAGAPLEDPRAARDHPHRRLQVVRDDAGEAVEVGVGPGQLVGVPGGDLLGPAALGEVLEPGQPVALVAVLVARRHRLDGGRERAAVDPHVLGLVADEARLVDLAGERVEPLGGGRREHAGDRQADEVLDGAAVHRGVGGVDRDEQLRARVARPRCRGA